jgi:hypothetical protein
MPKEIINFSSTIIYKIVCKDLNITDIYVGHTTNFIKRKAQHKYTCINPNAEHYNYKVYSTIRDNGNWENWDMIEIEKYNCNDKNEASARERYWYENLKANLNSNCPNQTNKESSKEYRINNKEKIKEKRNKVCICETCGANYTHSNKSRHEKSIFHINQLEQK